MQRNYVQDIRDTFIEMKENDHYRGNGTIEIRGASFTADQGTIFGTPNEDYIKAEIEWYETQDRSVYKLFEIYGKDVKIWNDVKDEFGEINSNYGYCIYHESAVTGHSQYEGVLWDLWDNPKSRQAVMYYTPTWIRETAGKDHICTTSTQWFINQGYLECVVNQRSSDAVFGYMNDVAWHKHVQLKLANNLSHAHLIIKPGPIRFNMGSLHVYERHYDLIK